MKERNENPLFYYFVSWIHWERLDTLIITIDNVDTRRRKDGKPYAFSWPKRERYEIVAKAVLAGKGKTVREIAAETGLDKSTAHRALQDIRQAGTGIEEMKDLIGEDVRLSREIQREIARRLREDPASMSGTDLKGFSELFLRRASLLSGQPTDIVAQVTVNIS